MAISLYNSPLGVIYIQEEDGYITNIYINEDVTFNELIDSAITLKAIAQLDLYFNGKLEQFELPLAPKGTAFRKKVWQALQKIPYGKTVSYKDLAIAIGNEKASRAVGQANGLNPIPIIIPCHRVINASGKLGGYSGGIDLKVKLLELEQKNKENF